MKNEIVSVIMSVYNGERYLNEAIESILSQTYQDFEFIIVDDGSTDRTADIIKSYDDMRIKYYYFKNSGVAASVNKGAVFTRSKYIARFDADDISMPERIERELFELNRDGNYVLAGSNAEVIDMDGNYLYTSSLPETNEEILLRVENEAPFYQSSVMFRKDAFLKCGGYFEPVRQYGEDFILWNNLRKEGRMMNLREPLIKYRLVPSATTNRNRKTTERIIGIAHRAISENSIIQQDADFLACLGNEPVKERITGYYNKIGCIRLYRRNERKKAVNSFMNAIIKGKINIKSIFFILLSSMPASLIDLWKKLRGIK